MQKQRWFQIHLSTAIVLMFAAGIFIYLNVGIATTDFKDLSISSDGPVIEIKLKKVCEYG